MDAIEKQIDQKNALNYVSSQFFKVMPFLSNSPDIGQVTIKVQSPHGSTNWLNISPSDCNAIEAILLNSYLKRV